MMSYIFLIGVSVIMPIIVVWMNNRTSQNETNKRTEILLKTIEAGEKIDPEILKPQVKEKTLGKFKFSANQSGSYFLSAFSEDATIVPPSLIVYVQPEKGEVIEVKNKKYTVTKLGTVKTGKKGKVTFSKSANNGKDAPKTVEYAGVTYKVKVVDCGFACCGQEPAGL